MALRKVRITKNTFKFVGVKPKRKSSSTRKRSTTSRPRRRR